jgi:dTDP-4-dehydrorhamnose reductase
MKYLLTGKDGQLGKEFARQFHAGGLDFFAAGRPELDITNLNNVLAVFAEVKPSVVINTAAYNQVDLAEKSYDLAYKANSLGIYNLLFACEKYSTFLVHYSTDYVFDGQKGSLYTEEDPANPLSEYGKSKYLGEVFLNESSINSLLFRTSWVYGEGRQNFIFKFLEWAKNNHNLKITADEVSVPTSTKTIAGITLKALEAGVTGLYHLTNSGCCSRYELARFIAGNKQLNNVIEPVSLESFKLPAKRPPFSAMENQKIARLLGCDIPSWEKALQEFLAKGN